MLDVQSYKVDNSFIRKWNGHIKHENDVFRWMVVGCQNDEKCVQVNVKYVKFQKLNKNIAKCEHL